MQAADRVTLCPVTGDVTPATARGGEIPKWPKGADCKSVAQRFGGSNPPLPTRTRAVSSAGEHLLHTQGVTGSIPVPPTKPLAASPEGVGERGSPLAASPEGVGERGRPPAVSPERACEGGKASAGSPARGIRRRPPLSCRSGGIGRRVRLRGVWATVRVQVPPPTPICEESRWMHPHSAALFMRSAGLASAGEGTSCRPGRPEGRGVLHTEPGGTAEMTDQRAGSNVHRHRLRVHLCTGNRVLTPQAPAMKV